MKIRSFVWYFEIIPVFDCEITENVVKDQGKFKKKLLCSWDAHDLWL